MNSEKDSLHELVFEKEILELTILASGCFWCSEAVFQNLQGVIAVRSGYIGGKIENPSYREICSGLTGHAEAVEITFNPKIISFHQLLKIFWTTHDPTTLNSQGADRGTQYRSGIFYTSKEQQTIAEDLKHNFAYELWKKPIVTEITAASIFYSAEEYHQNYYNNNPNQAYCQMVINPKVQKLRKQFSEFLKN